MTTCKINPTVIVFLAGFNPGFAEAAELQKHAPMKRYSENIQQIQRRQPMPKCYLQLATFLKSHFGIDVHL